MNLYEHVDSTTKCRLIGIFLSGSSAIVTNKVRLCERSEPRSEPFVE